MSALEAIVEDLRALPPDKVEDAAWFVHALVADARRERAAILTVTANSLSMADVDEMEKAIADSCEDTDEHVW